MAGIVGALVEHKGYKVPLADVVFDTVADLNRMVEVASGTTDVAALHLSKRNAGRYGRQSW